MQYPHISRNDAALLPEDQNVFFLWLPKCAGTSIRNHLQHFYPGNFGHYNNNQDTPRTPFVSDFRCATCYHSHVPSLIETGFIPKRWIEGAFIFAFVRNPWHRMVSLYHYLIRMAYSVPDTFERFIEQVAAADYPRPGKLNLLGYYQANRLTDWLRPKGVWLPHFIGKVENIAVDWETVSTILGIPHQPMGHRNKSQHGPYQDYHTTRTRHLVADRFAEEIDIFEYTFN